MYLLSWKKLLREPTPTLTAHRASAMKSLVYVSSAHTDLRKKLLQEPIRSTRLLSPSLATLRHLGAPLNYNFH